MTISTVFSLPVLSLANVDTPEGEAAAAAQFRAAAMSTGFLQLVDHSIPPALIARAFNAAERFFALPAEVKLGYARNPRTNRGYEVLGGQVLEGSLGATEHEGKRLVAEVKLGDQKEGLMMGRDEVDEGKFGRGKNVWPDDTVCEGLRGTVVEYYDAALALATRLMSLASLSLGLDPATHPFPAHVMSDPLCFVRLLHYPPSPPPSSPSSDSPTGIGSHTDFGFLTLLATSGTPGLEIYAAGRWQACEPEPGAFIVNVGDCLSQLTGGEYKSSLHRVVNRSGRSRYSVPFFVEGNLGFVVKPLRDEGDGKEWPTVEHVLRSRFDSTYKQ